MILILVNNTQVTTYLERREKSMARPTIDTEKNLLIKRFNKIRIMYTYYIIFIITWLDLRVKP